MTLTKPDVSELLDATRAGGHIDVIRKGVELVLQALSSTPMPPKPSAPDRYERSEGRTTWRNGNRERLLSTKAGDVELKTPSSVEARSSLRSSSASAASTGLCSPWSWRPTCTASRPARSTT